MLEKQKINYLLIDPSNQYYVDEKSDNKNLNTYNEKIRKGKRKSFKVIDFIRELIVVLDLRLENFPKKVKMNSMFLVEAMRVELMSNNFSISTSPSAV